MRLNKKSRFRRLLLCLFAGCLLCGCGQAGLPDAQQSSSLRPDEQEFVTAEEIYQQALGLLCNGDADYRQNAAAKQLLEIIRGYRDSEKYLEQIFSVCTKVSGRIDTEYLYDPAGHVQFEKGNPYYDVTEGKNDRTGITYEYADGLIIQEAFPNGDKVVFRYDDGGRIIERQNRYSEGEPITYTYHYELDDKGRIVKRTGYMNGEMAGEQTSEYRTGVEGTLMVIQHENVPGRNPSEKMRLLFFDNDGKLVRIENEERSITYTYEYVWLPEHDPDEEFVYEHRIKEAYF